MATEIRVSAAFEQDLFDALAYLENVLHESGAAKRLMEEIDAAEELIAESPFLDAVYYQAHGSDYRRHFVMNYVIVYKVEEGCIWFLRLFHQRQSYGRFVVEWSR